MSTKLWISWFHIKIYLDEFKKIHLRIILYTIEVSIEMDIVYTKIVIPSVTFTIYKTTAQYNNNNINHIVIEILLIKCIMIHGRLSLNVRTILHINVWIYTAASDGSSTQHSNYVRMHI